MNERMQLMKKYFILFFVCALIITAAPGCGSPDKSVNENEGTAVIKLEGTSVSVPSGVTADGSSAVITGAGTYEITGSLDNGQIIVNSTGNVTLVLNNADIKCDHSAPIYVISAGHVYIQLPEGSTNTISDGASYSLEPGANEPDAALFTKADMTVSGEGTLNVNANYNDAVAGRDSVTIESGNINITAVNHGIKGKDYLSIKGGNITVNAGNDAVKSTNDKDASLGYLEISGGTLTLTASDEAISAITRVSISGGTVNIDTKNNAVKSDGNIEITGGTVDIKTEDKDFVYTGECIIGENADVTSNGEKITG